MKKIIFILCTLLISSNIFAQIKQDVSLVEQGNTQYYRVSAEAVCSYQTHRSTSMGHINEIFNNPKYEILDNGTLWVSEFNRETTTDIDIAFSANIAVIYIDQYIPYGSSEEFVDKVKSLEAKYLFKIAESLKLVIK